MGRLIGGIFSNDSAIGRVMTALWIIIASNILFSVFALPVVTIGPGLAALHYVMLKRLHRDSQLSPVRTFWEGFTQNLKQGIICWLGFLALAVFLILDIRFCSYHGGVLTPFKYGLYAIAFLALMLWIHLMPVMAAFEDTIPHLLRNALFFVVKNPFRAAMLALIWAVPIVVTYLDERMRPLYGFLWVTCVAGILAAVTSNLLYRDIAQYLPSDEKSEDEKGLAGGRAVTGTGAAAERKQPGEKSERRTRKEMEKLDR
ncbi:MAG: YesL family protein [Lachnospiraceae bacterium]|nr:YesL family protein [Lachnospiraceae bacterium]